jgi:hypothetical protein
MIALGVYLNIINSKTFKPLISTRVKSPCASLESWLESCTSTASRSGERVERAACGSRYLSQAAWPAGCCQKTWQSHEDTVRRYPIPTQFLNIKSWRNRDVRALGSVKSSWASDWDVSVKFYFELVEYLSIAPEYSSDPLMKTCHWSIETFHVTKTS